MNTALHRPESAIIAERRIAEHHDRPRNWLQPRPWRDDDGPDNDVTQRLKDRRRFFAAARARVDAPRGAVVDSYDDDVTCYRCGAMNKTLVGGATWRWTGEHWEHRCSGLHRRGRQRGESP